MRLMGALALQEKLRRVCLRAAGEDASADPLPTVSELIRESVQAAGEAARAQFEADKQRLINGLDFIIGAVSDALAGEEFNFVKGRVRELEAIAARLDIRPPITLHFDDKDPLQRPSSITVASPDNPSHRRSIGVTVVTRRPNEPLRHESVFGPSARGVLLSTLRLWRIAVQGMSQRGDMPRGGPDIQHGIVYDDRPRDQPQPVTLRPKDAIRFLNIRDGEDPYGVMHRVLRAYNVPVRQEGKPGKKPTTVITRRRGRTRPKNTMLVAAGQRGGRR